MMLGVVRNNANREVTIARHSDQKSVLAFWRSLEPNTGGRWRRHGASTGRTNEDSELDFV